MTETGVTSEGDQEQQKTYDKVLLTDASKQMTECLFIRLNSLYDPSERRYIVM